MKTKIKIGIILILSLFFIIMCLNIYKQSPRHIIKDTVMWYEKDFTIPLFCKKVKFEYDKKRPGVLRPGRPHQGSPRHNGTHHFLKI